MGWWGELNPVLFDDFWNFFHFANTLSKKNNQSMIRVRIIANVVYLVLVG